MYLVQTTINGLFHQINNTSNKEPQASQLTLKLPGSVMLMYNDGGHAGRKAVHVAFNCRLGVR